MDPLFTLVALAAQNCALFSIPRIAWENASVRACISRGGARLIEPLPFLLAETSILDGEWVDGDAAYTAPIASDRNL